MILSKTIKWNSTDSNPKKLSNFIILLLNPTAKYYYLFIESYFIPGLANCFTYETWFHYQSKLMMQIPFYRWGNEVQKLLYCLSSTTHLYIVTDPLKLYLPISYFQGSRNPIDCGLRQTIPGSSKANGFIAKVIGIKNINK